MCPYQRPRFCPRALGIARRRGFSATTSSTSSTTSLSVGQGRLGQHARHSAPLNDCDRHDHHASAPRPNASRRRLVPRCAAHRRTVPQTSGTASCWRRHCWQCPCSRAASSCVAPRAQLRGKPRAHRYDRPVQLHGTPRAHHPAWTKPRRRNAHPRRRHRLDLRIAAPVQPCPPPRDPLCGQPFRQPAHALPPCASGSPRCDP